MCYNAAMARDTRSERTVYSTERGRICPSCGKPVSECNRKTGGDCGKGDAAPAQTDGIVRVGRSTQGRRGKAVTTVTGIPLSGRELKALAKTLKAKCGAGGTVKDGVIEIQGEHADLLKRELSAMGHRVK